jgi:hypothetical protein
MSLREKVLSMYSGAWKSEPSARVAGVLGGAGGLLGSAVAHALSTAYPAVVTGVIASASVLVGFAALAIAD